MNPVILIPNYHVSLSHPAPKFLGCHPRHACTQHENRITHEIKNKHANTITQAHTCTHTYTYNLWWL